MKRERAQLSAKNPCRIPKHRYYELKHFCLQYPDWKKALVLLDGWNTEPRDIPGIIKGRPPESPTERQAIARLYYSGQIAIVDRCIKELDPTLAPFILKGVTEGIGFEKLQAQGCPCCREMYYEYYRYFFWLLSKPITYGGYAKMCIGAFAISVAYVAYIYHKLGLVKKK